MGSDSDDDKKSARPSGPGFISRWVRRLFVLALLGAGALAYGFYQRPGLDGQPQKKLPWDDPSAFREYSVATLTWARTEGEKLAQEAKTKIAEIEWSKETDALWEKANKLLAGEPGASAGSSASPAGDGPSVAASTAPSASSGASAAPLQPSTAPKGAPPSAAAASASGGSTAASAASPDDPQAGPGSPARPGYYEAYKAGYQAYRAGLVHFRDAKAKKDRAKELKSALQRFQEASAQWQKAQELRDTDPRLDELMKDLNQYIFETRKALKAV